MQAAFADELARFGPQADQEQLSLDECRQYCRQLARRHYENFTVASRLLAGALRQHFYHVYCLLPLGRRPGRRNRRPTAEPGTVGLVGRRTARWHTPANRGIRCFCAEARRLSSFRFRPIRFAACWWPFARISTCAATTTFEQLLSYCRNSANPVGHLVLYLARSYDEDTALLSEHDLHRACNWPISGRTWPATGIAAASICHARRAEQFGYDR